MVELYPFTKHQNKITTYINNVSDQFGHSALVEYLALRGVFIKDNIKRRILVSFHSFIISTEDYSHRRGGVTVSLT